MGFIFSGLFWGSILILIGASIIIKAVFKIDIPVVRIIFALIIIYLGLRLLFPNFRLGENQSNTIMFEKRRINTSGKNNEYNMVFGSGTIDLSDLDPEKNPGQVEVNTVFASSRIILNPEIPFLIRTNTFFADCTYPKGSAAVIGESVVRSPAFNSEDKALLIEVNVVFGSAKIIY